MKTIFSGGGFHNVGDMEIEILERDGDLVCVSEDEYSRIAKHFCGMTDCVCNSEPIPVKIVLPVIKMKGFCGPMVQETSGKFWLFQAENTGGAL